MANVEESLENMDGRSAESLTDFESDGGCRGQDAFLQGRPQDSDASGSNSGDSMTKPFGGAYVSSCGQIDNLSMENSCNTLLFNYGGEEETPNTMVTQGASQPFECSFCHRQYKSRFVFKVHLQSHTGRRYQCVICGRAFTQRGNVKKHIEHHKVYPHMTLRRSGTVTGSSLFVQLDEGTSSSASIQRQDGCKQNDGPIATAFQCPYCSDLFHCYGCFQTHLPTHKDKKVFQCPMRKCRELHSNLEEFLTHLSSHSGYLTYDCPICGKKFNSLSDIGVHQCAHLIANEKRPSINRRLFRCIDCGDFFKSSQSLERHYAQTPHMYECIKCKRLYTSAKRLRKHLKTHQQQTSKFVCSLCGRTYSYKCSLKVHIKRVHESPDSKVQFTCSHCSKTFKRSDVLRRHESSVHCGISHFRCTFEGCGKQFKRADRLKEHVLVHSDSKKHQCTSCDKSFARLQSYKSHVRTVHDKKYRIHCDGCQRGFNRPDKYERHRRRWH